VTILTQLFDEHWGEQKEVVYNDVVKLTMPVSRLQPYLCIPSLTYSFQFALADIAAAGTYVFECPTY
jgi:hypothetical protein